MHRDYESHRYPGSPRRKAKSPFTGRLLTRIVMLVIVMAGWYAWRSGNEPERQAPGPPAASAPAAPSASSSPDATDATDATSRSLANGTDVRGDATQPLSTDALGQLTELPGDVQRSTAGLQYGPGSREGHRLDHVLRHARDDPQRPGEHGVFEGDRATILAVIDEAYLRSQRGEGHVEQDRQRTVLTVDLGRRIGFVGGQSGNRRDRPPATHVRLVLEGTNVITAYPLRP